MKNRKLADELKMLLGCFEELHSCLEQETRGLTDIDLEVMAEINRQKEAAALKIESRTELIRTLLREALLEEGLDPDATLGVLAKKLKTKGPSDVVRLHQELNRVAEENRQLLAVNREIAEKFSAMVGNTLDVISRVINQSNVYGSSGGYQQRPTGSVLINREA